MGEKARIHRLNDVAATLVLCLAAMVIMIRLVLRQYRRIMRALRKSEEKSNLLIRHAPVAIYEINARATDFLMVNDTMCDMLGYTREELLALRPLDLVDDAGRALFADRIARRLARGMADGTVEMNIRRKDGRRVHGLMKGVPSLVGDNGQPEKMLVFGNDITRRNLQEEALRRHAADLTAANQNLEAFAYSVSHDLRNPLQSILACGEMMKAELTPEQKDAREALDHIIRAGERMAQVITDLLALSRIAEQTVRREPIDLSAMAEGILAELTASDPSRSVELRIEPGHIVHADQGLVRILMENLIHNAWKFSSKKDAARIEFGRHGVEDPPVYFVRDNGAGFPMSAAERLFKPFHRLHSGQEYAGTGIGLTIVKRIVEKHGGDIHTEADIDSGATFYFRLQMKQSEMVRCG